MEQLEQLNEEQLAPVLDTEGAVLVLAGAGSGKTRVLTSRIAHLVTEKGIPPENILAITFTNKAANEMRERLGAMTDVSRMWVCTIHSMCVKILRMFADRRGLSPNFSIYSEQERSAVIKQAFKECGFDDEDGKLLKSIKWHISNAKMLGLTPSEYAQRNRYESNVESAVKVYEKYDAHLKAYNALDFDDLLTEALELLKEDAEALSYLAGRFRYVHVDEFQDTNAVQFEIVKCLSSVHGNLFVVGDDDQSIYGWRGAKIENILGFERVYPKAKVYKLQQNYRSTKAILALANASIAHNAHRKGKTLRTENAEGDAPVYYEAEDETSEALYCARMIASLRAQGYRLSDFAVLMRINALTRSYEQEFTKYGISYKVFGGFKFFERKEIKDILAYLRVAGNPFDSEAVARIINVPRRGIGEKTVQTLFDYAEREDVSLYDAVLDCDLLPVNGGTKEKLRAFGKYLKDLVLDAQVLPVDTFVRELVESSGMREQYADNSDESVTKRANIDEFLNAVEEFVRMNPEASLSDYLQQITLYSDTDEMDDGDYVTIATIHAVKGLEFRCVFVVGLEEDVMPTSRAQNDPASLEEERRLMYVAITRAREKLYLTRSRSRYLYGHREATARSQFITELEDELHLPKQSTRFSEMSDGYERGYGSYGAGRGSGGFGGFGNGYGGYGSRSGGYERSSRGSDYGSSYGSRGGYSDYGTSYGSRGESGFARSSYSGKREEESFRTFGAGSTPVSAPRTNSAPVKRFGNAGVTSAPQQPRKDTSGFAVGVRVRHARFGEGIITAMRGAGGNVIISVKFDKAGNKDLAAALAPLEII